jgi:hypothetical protein
VEGNPETSINLVHVEDVARAVTQQVLHPPSESALYPLTSPRPYQAREIKEEFCRQLGLEGIEWVPESFLNGRANVLEEKFKRMTASYRSYLFGMPKFQGVKGLRTDFLAEIVSEFLSELKARETQPEEATLGSMAIDCLDVKKPDFYFDKFSTGIFGDSFLKRIPFVSTKVRFHVIGDKNTKRTLLFDKGSVSEVPETEPVEFAYELSEEIFGKIIAGRLDPREAFFKGLLKIHGDQEQALKFGYLFTEHFLNIDQRILEELEGKRS